MELEKRKGKGIGGGVMGGRVEIEVEGMAGEGTGPCEGEKA